MPSKYFSLTITFLSLVLFLSPAFSQGGGGGSVSPGEPTITLITYYPSPIGVYKELRAKRMAIGSTYYNSSQYPWCENPGACFSNEIAYDADLVVEGNVGIGTVNPVYKLDVQGGAFRVQNSGHFVFNGAADITFGYPPRGAEGRAFVADNPDMLTINYEGDFAGGTKIGVNTFFAANTGNSYINTGNVGIGTTRPFRRFTIQGDGGGDFGTHLGFEAPLNGGTRRMTMLWDQQKLPKAPGKLVFFDDTDGGTIPFQFDFTNDSFYVQGNVGIGTTNPGGYRLYVNGTAYSTGGWRSSDIRYKKNIKDIQNALEKILKVRGVSFEWDKGKNPEKKFPQGRHYGVIAQEIEKIFPEIVRKGPDGEKAVSYNELVPILIEALKEQQKEIDKLKARLNLGKTRPDTY